MTATLERISCDDLQFDVRPGTSDEKAIREVVARRAYARYKFAPAADETWLDLGANVGAFSVWAATRHPTVRVHAYEPDPDGCELMAHNLRLNGVRHQVEITQAAVVTDRRRTAVLHCNTARGNVWRNSIEREWRGGEDIRVPARHISTVLPELPSGTYLKMDVEGTEMPILEWLLDHPAALDTFAGMVYEWSFDVDPSLDRFRQVVDGLKQHYTVIKNAQLPDDAPAEWPATWNPPCRLVWAWRAD